jgi:predicted nucleic acid-binding protein
MAEFLLDTNAASRLIRGERSAVTKMRQSGAKTVSISSVTMAELVYGARLREANPIRRVVLRRSRLRAFAGGFWSSRCAGIG